MSEIQKRIENMVQQEPVLLFMKGTPDFPQCGFSAKAVNILMEAGVPFAAMNVLEDDLIRQGVKEYAQWPTIPQLYINGEFQGGCDIMIEMAEDGSLSDALKNAQPSSTIGCSCC